MSDLPQLRSLPHPLVLQVSVSRGGLPKYAVPKAYATPLGLEGDRHAHPKIHGGPRKALLLILAAGIEQLARDGFLLAPGAMGENLTISGLDPATLRVGQRWRAGDHAVFEITEPRGPCRALDRVQPGLRRRVWDSRVAAGDATSPRWGLSGFYAAVVHPGWIRQGDIIEPGSSSDF